MLKNITLIVISIATLGSLYAKDYEVDKNGNVNLNIIDRKVIVNGKVVKRIPKGEPIKANVGNIGASIDDRGGRDNLNAHVGKNIGASIKGDSLSANVGGIRAKIDGDNISVDIGSLLNTAQKLRNSKDTKEEKDFFKGDDFFK